MKNALRIALLVLVAAAASLTVLGVNIFGFGMCENSPEKIAVLERITVKTDSDMLVVTLKPTISVRPGYT